MYSLGWCQRLFDELRAYCLADGPAGPPIDDPRISDRLADLWTALQDGRRAADRLTREEVEGKRSAAAASAAKVILTEYAPKLAQAATEFTGPAGSISGTLFGEPQAGAPARGRFAYEYLFRFDGPISVGANEIHRGGIAAALGLHRGGNRSLIDALRGDRPIGQRTQRILADADPAASDADPGYDRAAWSALLRDVWPQVGSPQDVRVMLDEIGWARCPLPIHAGLVQPLAALIAAGASGHAQALLSGTRYAIGLHDSGDALRRSMYPWSRSMRRAVTGACRGRSGTSRSALTSNAFCSPRGANPAGFCSSSFRRILPDCAVRCIRQSALIGSRTSISMMSAFLPRTCSFTMPRPCSTSP
jgi:hypothetical protein